MIAPIDEFYLGDATSCGERGPSESQPGGDSCGEDDGEEAPCTQPPYRPTEQSVIEVFESD